MNFKELASKIAKAEGKKSEAKIGDIREILKLFFDIIAEEATQEEVLEFMKKEFAKRKKSTK